MSELERPDDRGDDRITHAASEPSERRRRRATRTGAAPTRCRGHAHRRRGDPTGDAARPRLDATAPKKRRRRGSRGGRGRKKPAGAGAGADAGAHGDERRRATSATRTTAESTAAARTGPTPRPIAASRADDSATQAREDAGLSDRRNGGRPDRRPRPAPTAAAAAARRRQPGPGTPAAGRRGDDAGRRRRRAEEAPPPARWPRPQQGRRQRSGDGRDGRARNARPGRRAASRRVQYVDAGAPLTDVDVDGTALLDSLDDETLERRRGTRRKGRPAGRYLMVVHERDDGIAHIGVLEGRTLVEHYVVDARPTTRLSIDGNIYLGRVQNVLPGMEAAFIDIGTPKNGVLYRGDVVYDPADVEGKAAARASSACCATASRSSCRSRRTRSAHKGARLTQEVSLAGRFVVMVPDQPQTYGISKRLPDDERKRLRRVLDRLRPTTPGSSCAPRPKAPPTKSSSATCSA